MPSNAYQAPMVGLSGELEASAASVDVPRALLGNFRRLQLACGEQAVTAPVESDGRRVGRERGCARRSCCMDCGEVARRALARTHTLFTSQSRGAPPTTAFRCLVATGSSIITQKPLQNHLSMLPTFLKPLVTARSACCCNRHHGGECDPKKVGDAKAFSESAFSYMMSVARAAALRLL